MTQNFIETLIFATMAINAALLVFLAGVFRKMMNAIDEATFKNLILLMVKYSSKSPFMILVMNSPLLIATPYYYYYGFGNWWITSGLVFWLITGSLSKIYKLPVYKTLAILQSTADAEIGKERRKFNDGNVFQAVLYAVATVLIAFGLH